jgi:hypothetical protein
MGEVQLRADLDVFPMLDEIMAADETTILDVAAKLFNLSGPPPEMPE